VRASSSPATSVGSCSNRGRDAYGYPSGLVAVAAVRCAPGTNLKDIVRMPTSTLRRARVPRGRRLLASSTLLTVSGVAALVLPPPALAADGTASGCELAPDVSGRVAVLANDFVTTNVIAREMERCGNDELVVDVNLNTEVRDIQVAALSSDPARYGAVMTANGSVVPLLNENLLRPLDDLVERYGSTLTERQKITIDGKIVAIAFMANAQHLVYREDLLEEAGVEPPTSYEEVIEAARVIREKGILENPLAGTYKTGFNLGLEFVNLYSGLGGELFEPDSARPAIANERGVEALETMKALTSYMDSDFLTFDTNAIVAEIEQGEVAIANLWGSSVGSVLDENGATDAVREHLRLSAAPTIGGGDIPATTLWWDGFGIARKLSDEDTEATFRLLLASTGERVANAHGDAAVWLAEGYEPTPTGEGVLATIAAGARPYPVTSTMSLMNVALGTELVEFLQGSESAEQALADVESSYATAARTGGFL